MSRIVQAVNSMISHPNLITNVMRNGEEIFFLYKDKYKWSMRRADGSNYFLYYYPGEISIDELASLDDYEWNGFTEMVVYSTTELGTREAEESFSELHTILRERMYGINEVFDDIISNNDDF